MLEKKAGPQIVKQNSVLILYLDSPKTSPTFIIRALVKKATFYSNDKKTVRVYDHILAGSWVKKHTLNCRVRNSIKVDSDHRCVVARFAFPLYKRDRRLTKKKKKRNTPRLDVKLFRKNPEIQALFLESLKLELGVSDNLLISEINAIMTTASANKSMGHRFCVARNVKKTR